MKLTTNYGLKKPEGSDVVNIDDFNYNADTIDTKLKVVENQSNANKNNISTLQSEVSTNKTSISNLNSKTDTTNRNLNALISKVNNAQNTKLTQDNGKAFGISNGDANNLIGIAGALYVGENITNSPRKSTGIWWTIENYVGSDGWGHQTATAWHSDERYIRRCNGGTWAEWREL